MFRLLFRSLVLLEEAKGNASMSHAELLVVQGNTDSQCWVLVSSLSQCVKRIGQLFSLLYSYCHTRH